MEYLNKIITTVATVKTTVNYALPGNIVAREYDIFSQSASAGPGLLWKIHSGQKKTTKKEVSVWIFEKKALEMVPLRSDREALLESLKAGVSRLTSGLPRLIQVEHSLEESRDCIAFCTEPVLASLSNIIGPRDNLPQAQSGSLDEHVLEQSEIKHGLLEPSYPLIEYNQLLTPYAQPPLNYFAPEYLISCRCDAYSDIFSLGIVIYSIFNNGRPLFEYKNNIENYRKHITKLKSLSVSALAKIPEDLREDLKLTLHTTPELRPDALQITKKMLTRKILPFVSEELKSVDIIPFVLPILLYIGEKMEANEFSTLLLPILTPVFLMQTPYQIPIMLMQKMSMFLSKSPPNRTRDLVLPMMYAALDSNVVQLQEPCLGILPDVVHLVDSKMIKSRLIPRVLNLACEVNTISVKVNALLSIGRMAEKLEKWMITDQVLPALSKFNSKEPAVLMAILGIFKICFTSPKISLTKEACAKYCLPFLISSTVENSLNLKQFELFMALIKEMLRKVEHEQRRKLQQFDGNVENECPNSISNNQEVIHKSTSDISSAKNQVSSSHSTVVSKKPLSLEEKKQLAAEHDQAIKSRHKPEINILTPVQVHPTVGRAIPVQIDSNFNTSLGPISGVSPVSRASATVQRSQIGQLNDFAVQPTSSNRIAPSILHPTPLHPKSYEDWSIFLDEGEKLPAQLNVSSLSNLQNPTVCKAPSTTVNRWSAADNVKTASKNGKSSLDDLVIFPLRPARQTLKMKGKNDFDDLLK